MSSEFLLKVENISKDYRVQQHGTLNRISALNNVSFELKHGESLGVIGKNGAGKSTLLKILSGIAKPTGGEALVHGRITSILEVGGGVHPELTGIENIFLKGNLHGIKKKEIKKYLPGIIAFSGLDEHIHKPLKTYSSGMYLRLAFSVFCHLPTDLLILDEVLFVGDRDFSNKSFNKIRELKKKGVSLLIAGHDLGKMEQLCEKGLVLEQGKNTGYGPFQDVLGKYLVPEKKKPAASASEIAGPLFENEYIKVDNCYFLKSGSDRGKIIPFTNNEAIEMIIDYTIKQSISGLDFGLVVSNSGGTLITDSPHFKNEKRTALRPGAYKRKITIPGNIFFRGIFFISVFIGKRNLSFGYLKEILKFRVSLKKENKFWSDDAYRPPLRMNFSWEDLPA